MNSLPTLLIACALFIASCDRIQNFASDHSFTDTLTVLEEYSPEIKIADPDKILAYGVKYLNIDNCIYPGHCYHTRYEFNSCGKVATYCPPMVATRWTYTYDDQCRVITEMASEWTRKDISYFKPDSMWVTCSPIINEKIGAIESQFKCKAQTNWNNINNPGQDLTRTDTVGTLSFPCGEIYEGVHIVKTYFHEHGIIEKVEYYDDKNNQIIVEEFQYSDETNTPIHFSKKNE